MIRGSKRSELRYFGVCFWTDPSDISPFDMSANRQGICFAVSMHTLQKQNAELTDVLLTSSDSPKLLKLCLKNIQF